MAISKNLNLWCCEANVVELDGFVLEKILPKTGLLYPLAEISLMALRVDFTNKCGESLVFLFGNLLQFGPERILQADAGLIPNLRRRDSLGIPKSARL